MSRKAFALLIALLLVLTMTMGAAAAEEGGKITLTARHNGSTISVALGLEGAPGITNGRVIVEYDAEAVSLQDVQVLAQTGAASVNREEDEMVSLAWVGSNLEDRADLAVLTFAVTKEGETAFSARMDDAYAGETKAEFAPADVTAACHPFTDITGHWAEEEILDAYYAGLFKGVTDTTFAPDRKMNRAMFVTTLYRMEQEPEAQKHHTFTDVPQGCYYEKAVSWAVEQEITNGVGNDLFAPGKVISRQEMATMLYRYAGLKGMVDGELGTPDLGFTDENQISGWAKEAVCWAVEEQILEGYPGNRLIPRAALTRAQGAVVLCRYMNL